MQIGANAMAGNDAREGRDLTSLLRRDAPVYAVGITLFVIALAIFAAYGISVAPDLILANTRLYLIAGFAMLVFDAAFLLIKERPQSPTHFLIKTYKARLTSPATRASIPLFALIATFMPFFSKFKSMIPLFNEFSWDETFIAWDRALFLGYDAWEVMQPLLGYPIVSAAMAGLYHLWMLLIYMGTLFFLFYAAGRPVARQYLLGFFLIWTVVGGAMATALASVGPVFVGPILGMDTFDNQMAYLNAANEQVPVMTLHVQEMLLGWYNAGERGLGSGITAMPSMHVAMAMLFWLAIREVSPRAGRAFFVFFVLIWIGSVHLAYHYAVDGLVSIIATAILWHVAKGIVKRWDARLSRAPKDADQATLRTNTVPAE